MISNDLIKVVNCQNLKFNKLTRMQLDRTVENIVQIQRELILISKNQFHPFKILQLNI